MKPFLSCIHFNSQCLHPMLPTWLGFLPQSTFRVYNNAVPETREKSTLSPPPPTTSSTIAPYCSPIHTIELFFSLLIRGDGRSRRYSDWPVDMGNKYLMQKLAVTFVSRLRFRATSKLAQQGHRFIMKG